VRGTPAVRRRLRYLRCLRRLLLHVVRSADAVYRVHAGCAIDVRYADDRARPDAVAGFLRATGRRHSRSEDCTATAARCRRWSTRSVERVDWNSILRPTRVRAPARELEARVMSCRRAHQVSALRLVVVSRDPLAPDTDLHRRMIRECRVDCRTDGTSGRDEKDVGVRSCSCGVAVWLRRKVLLERLTGTAGKTHAKSGALFCLEVARYQRCARARMVLSVAVNVQQQVEW
jgi:hypothetical protein